jgi:hypothetical protein
VRDVDTFAHKKSNIAYQINSLPCSSFWHPVPQVMSAVQLALPAVNPLPPPPAASAPRPAACRPSVNMQASYLPLSLAGAGC